MVNQMPKLYHWLWPHA